MDKSIAVMDLRIGDKLAKPRETIEAIKPCRSHPRTHIEVNRRMCFDLAGFVDVSVSEDAVARA